VISEIERRCMGNHQRRVFLAEGSIVVCGDLFSYRKRRQQCYTWGAIALERDAMSNFVTFVVCALLFGLFLPACAPIKETFRTIGHTTRDVTTEVGHTTRDVTREIGHGTRDVVRDIGQGTRDATKSASETVKKAVRPAPSSEY
jgi:hypothetical protein